MYIPLAEVQIKTEEDIVKYPLSKVDPCTSIVHHSQPSRFLQRETNISDTPAERLYRATVTQIPQFLVRFSLFLVESSMTTNSCIDRSAETSVDIDTDGQGQNGFDQHPVRCDSRGNAQFNGSNDEIRFRYQPTQSTVRAVR